MPRFRTYLVVLVLMALVLPTALVAAPLTPRLLGVKVNGSAAKSDDKISAIRADVIARLEKVDAAIKALSPAGHASLRSSVRLEIASLSESIGALRREVRVTPNLEPLLAELERTRTGLDGAASRLDEGATGYAEQVTVLTDAVSALREVLGVPATPPAMGLPDALALGCNALLLAPPSRGVGTPALGAIKTNQAEVEKYLKTRAIVTDDLFTSSDDDRALALAGVCAKLLQDDAADLPDTDTPEVHAALVETQWSISILRKWQRKLSERKGSQASELVTRSAQRVVDAERAVDMQLGSHGLDRLVSAGLFVGTMVGGSGRRLVESTGASNELSLKEVSATVPVTLLNIETKHWGALGQHTRDLSFRSVAGFKSVLVPVLATGVQKAVTTVSTEPTSSGTATTTVVTTTTVNSTRLDPVLATTLQEAFVFGFGGRLGAYSRRDMELSLVVQGIGSTLWSDKVLLEAGNTETVVAQPANAASRTEWAYEVGGELKLFDNPIRVVHAEGGMVSPALAIAAGYRYDTRLRPTGALGAAALGLRNSEHRFYFRVMWDPLKNLYARETAAQAKPFDLGVGVESESPGWGQGATSIPRNTRFIIRGSLDLLRVAFKESDGKK